MPKEPKNMSYDLWADALKQCSFTTDDPLDKNEMTARMFYEQGYTPSVQRARVYLRTMVERKLATCRPVIVSGKRSFAYTLTKRSKK